MVQTKTLLFAFPVLTLMLLVELGCGLWKGRNTYADTKDTFSRLSLGLMQVMATALWYSATLALVYFLYDHRVFEIGHS